MKALLFGATGQVGTCLQQVLDAAGDEVLAPRRDQVDLADPAAVAAAVADSGADVVYNTAAYTAVDRAEEEPDLAAAINMAAPAAMARAAAAAGMPLIHVSTDYVFGGAGPGRPWREDDPAEPVNVYGRTKLAGEQAVLAGGGAAIVLRTAWVFSAEGSNFVKTVLRLAEGGAPLTIVADQVGCPTPAAAIAGTMRDVAVALRADPGLAGLYHYAGRPAVSWAGFARGILAAAGRAAPVEDIATADWPTTAQRPPYTVLDTGRIKDVFGVEAPPWRPALAGVLREVTGRHEHGH